MWLGIIGVFAVFAVWLLLVVAGAVVTFRWLRGDKSPRQRMVGRVALVITILLALGLAYVSITTLILSSEVPELTF
jgi:hypothetical protein